MLIPLRHESMQGRRWPVITIGLIVLNILFFLVTHEKIDMVTVDRAYEISRMRGLLAWAPPTGYVGGIEKTCTALGWSK